MMARSRYQNIKKPAEAGLVSDRRMADDYELGAGLHPREVLREQQREVGKAGRVNGDYRLSGNSPLLAVKDTKSATLRKGSLTHLVLNLADPVFQVAFLPSLLGIHASRSPSASRRAYRQDVR